LLNTCTICHHPAREAIEADLLAGHAWNRVGRAFDITRSSVQRHAKGHMGLTPSHLRIAGCSICDSPDRIAIDAALTSGQSATSLAREFPFSHSLMLRHRALCLKLPRLGKASCAICAHPDRDEIESLLRSEVLLKDIARHHGVSQSSLTRHWTAHLGMDARRHHRVGCLVCHHPKRAEIEAALIKGEPRPTVARRFGLAPHRVRWHAKAHLERLLSAERDAVMAEVMAAEQAQMAALLRLRRHLARPEAQASDEGARVIESARAILERHDREAAKAVALAMDFLKQARGRKRAAEIALQDLERADTELARRKVAREITDRQQSAD
jgi:AraC-like DNA-binding protein